MAEAGTQCAGAHGAPRPWRARCRSGSHRPSPVSREKRQTAWPRRKVPRLVGFNIWFPMDIKGPQLEAMTPVQKARNCRSATPLDVRMCDRRMRRCAGASLASQVLGKSLRYPVLREMG
jgi:hypothetical protein